MAVAVLSASMGDAVHLREAFKFALSLALVYMIALAMDWERPFWAGLSVSLCSMATAGASLNKGAMRIIGCLFGCVAALVMVELFAQQRWSMLLVFMPYIFVLSVLMLVSAYWYAYKSTLLVTVLIVAASYGDWTETFTVSMERTLETIMGVVVYMLVSALLWPRYAGDALHPQVAGIFEQLAELHRLWRAQVAGASVAAEFHRTRRAFLAGIPKTEETLAAAFGDTPAVRRHRRSWEHLCRTVRDFYDATILLHESSVFWRSVPLARALPGVDETLERIEDRLVHAAALWQQARAGKADPAGDSTSSQAGILDVDDAVKNTLSFEQRAAFVTFVEQVRILDETSRELVAIVRVLTGLDTGRNLGLRSIAREPFRSPLWDPEILLNALRPVLTFTLVFLGWITIEGFPGGALALPLTMVVVTFIIREVPADPFRFARPFALGLLVTAPLYFFVLPWLETPYGLFLLLFLFSFPWGYVGSRGDMFLKFWVMLTFLATTQIDNARTYSFEHFADFSLLLMLAIVSTALAFCFLPSTQPEKVFLRTLQVFFRSCARLVAARTCGHGAAQKGFAKAPFLRARVNGLPQRLRAPASAIDYDAVGGGTVEQVDGFLDSLQSVAFRLRALEDERDRAAEHSGKLYETVRDMSTGMRMHLRELFEGWAGLESVAELGEKRMRYRRELEAVGTRLREFADTADLKDDRSLRVLFSTHVAAIALANALGRLEVAVEDMDLRQWAVPRFSKP